MQSDVVTEITIPGRIIRVTHIRLYHAKAVSLWRQHLAYAQELLGGFNTGIGFIGSPGWAIGGALVLGAIESAVSSTNAKQGIHKLAEANKLLDQMRLRSMMFPASQIQNIDRPSRGEWKTVHNDIQFIDLNEDFLHIITEDNIEMYLKFSETLSYHITRLL